MRKIKMKLPDKILKLSPLLLGFFLLVSVVAGLSVWNSPSANALTKAQANQKCALKVQESSCLKLVATCAPAYTVACVNQKSKPGNLVYPACRTASNPQACHAKAKTDCAGKTGTALQACQSQAAGGSGAGTGTAANNPGTAPPLKPKGTKTNTCGKEDPVKTWINFGCLGDKAPAGTGPIEDLAYALIRFLSYGVGLVMVASIIYAGIQYSSSSGNPEQTSMAKKRILNALVGLIFYLLIWAFIQYLVPGGLFK